MSPAQISSACTAPMSSSTRSLRRNRGNEAIAAAHELQAEPDSEQQGEDGVELALHQHVLGKLDDAVQAVRAEGRCALRRDEKQAEEYERIRQQDAAHGDTPEYVQHHRAGRVRERD